MAFATIDVTKGITGVTPTANLPTIPVTKGGTNLTSGTTDQFLKFTGTTTLASAADNAGLVKLHESEASSVSSKVINSIFSDTYDRYLLEVTMKPADDNEVIYMDLVDSGGSSLSSNYYGATLGYTQGGAEDRGNYAATSYFYLYGDSGCTNTRFQNLSIMMNGMTSGHSNYTGILWQSRGFTQGADFEYHTGGGFSTSSTDATGVRFKYNSGNISQSTFTVYGMVGTGAVS